MEGDSLTFLEQVSGMLSHIPYSSVYEHIGLIRPKAIATALMKKGHFIERARINWSGEVFTSEEQISYISDPAILAGKVKRGRANEAGQSAFYGAIISPEVKEPRATIYLETSSRLQELKTPGPFEEIYTVSRWRIVEDFEVVEIIHSDAYNKNSSYARMSLKHQEANFKRIVAELHSKYGTDYTEFLNKQMKFFSNEFARKDIYSDDDYKISSAYTNYILDNTPFLGITYPSVKMNYMGQNLVLSPKAVDNYLKLESVYMCKAERTYNESLTVTVKSKVVDFGKDNSAFIWAPIS